MKEKNTENYSDMASKPLKILKGIGPKRAELFSRLGIETVGDLLDHFPRTYQNRGNIRLISQRDEEMCCSFLLTVATVPRTVKLKNRMELTKFSAFDESGRVTVCFFNSRFTDKVFDIGQTWRFWGKINGGKNGLILSSPIYERADIGKPLPGLVPVYPSTAGLSQNNISEAIRQAYDLLDVGGNELLPPDLIEAVGTVGERDAYRYVHYPKNIEEVKEGRKYFSLRDVFMFSLALQSARQRKKHGIAPKITVPRLNPYLNLLKFEMTNAQKRAVNEILYDMTEKNEPMMRLLSGDVGSGKTAVAGATMYICASSGRQAALMAPTEILASQHYEKLSPLFERLGFRTALLTGGLKESEKRKVREQIKNGEADIVIGTHALISKNTKFASPGLTVIDEQHRFGVIQRACVAENSDGNITPHVLVMSATPIPRTMGLIVFGELSHSVLDELPPGRQAVKTYVVDSGYRERLYSFIEKQISEGGRVYVVCSAIEQDPEREDTLSGDILEDEKTPLRTAVDVFAELCEHLDGIGVGLVHGKMKPAEKEKAMNDFSSGETRVLVSTTVIEVGVDVPEATLMIVENAERFGLATLHQLRGRVGRGKKQSYCVLISDSKSESARGRLDVMKNSNDGFRIAEYDLEQRGPGDYFPIAEGRVRQHGEMNIPVTGDMEMLKAASNCAVRILSSDPNLDGYPALKEMLSERLAGNERLMQ